MAPVEVGSHVSVEGVYRRCVFLAPLEEVLAIVPAGKMIFIELRDRSGIIQVVFHPGNAEALAAAADCPPHTIICEPVHTATWLNRPAGTLVPVEVAVQESVAGV